MSGKVIERVCVRFFARCFEKVLTHTVKNKYTSLHDRKHISSYFTIDLFLSIADTACFYHLNYVIKEYLPGSFPYVEKYKNFFERC